ncbi:MAG TPA: FAD-dependent oxidoreductase [Verrucomicrobiae bacterium]|nr:FAD-dependent oxidoreductase [Verrucomicrobiae bacterium]
MRHKLRLFELLALSCVVLLSDGVSSAATVVESDICVYGGTSGGVAAVVQAKRMGKTASLAVFSTHLGGLTSGGLGATDVGNQATIGGVSREFYRRIGQRYNQTERFNFEPHVAREVFEAWLAEVGVTPRFNQRLASVAKTGQRITQITMEDGTIYRAKMFIDATYEGDLMAMAGVSFTFGREGTNVYGETLNGIRANTPAHQFTVNVDPYVIPGNPASGLLPFVQPGDGGTPGDGDHRIQAYNYRLCFTQNATNRLPHVVPPNYDPARYELLGRLLDARVANGDTLTINNFFSVSAMPNGKTDMNNNGAFSTDYIGMNWTYPTNTYAAREQMDIEHREYIQGLIQYLATSPRSPANLRAQVLSWGPCKDEWQETGGYSPQIYVREARRMVSDYVMTQGDCQNTRVAPDSVCLGSYNMDSHNCQRIVKNGFARNEGDVQVSPAQPYPISYRSIVPRVGECENLFVTFAISATHIAFGSTRMEPVFMMASQSAATAASFAIDDQLPVQQVNYAKLALQLAADGQVLTWGSSGDTAGVIVDNSNSAVTYTGVWSNSTSVTGYWGANYQHDGNEDKGNKSATFQPNLPTNDTYHVYLRWTTNPNRATNVPVDIIHPAGTNTVLANQMLDNGTWVHLLTTNFNAGTNSALRIRNSGTTGFVIADAARWVSATASNLPVVQLIASDPIASETGKTARLLFARSINDTNTALTIFYQLSGNASNGVDFATLPGSLALPAGVASTNLVITAPSDANAEGDKTLIVSLQAGTNYGVGPLSKATVHILDLPFDAWRFKHFTASELADLNISGPDADPDSDGATNRHEFLSGTDPRDSASVLRVRINTQTNTAIIQFTAGSNRAFTLQYRDHPGLGTWLELTNIAPVNSNRTIVCSDPFPVGVSNRFYRVSAL